MDTLLFPFVQNGIMAFDPQTYGHAVIPHCIKILYHSSIMLIFIPADCNKGHLEQMALLHMLE